MYIYKYMSFEQFISMIELKRLYLTKILQWEDIYEGYSFKNYTKKSLHDLIGTSFGVGDSQIEELSNFYMKHIYGQSWSWDQNESDAMWRIYSEDGMGVRIKVDSKDNAIALQNSLVPKNVSIDEFSVIYTNNLEKNINDEDSLKLKRKPFEHEKEYRFLGLLMQTDTVDDDVVKILSKEEKADDFLSDNVLYYDIKLNFIKQVLLDPRSPKYHEDTFCSYCKNRKLDEYGIEFYKSKLYTII